MVNYTFFLHAAINPEEFVNHQIDFPAGMTPAVPQVGDEIGFTKGNRHYWATIEERFFDYAEDAENVNVCLMGFVNGSSEVPRGRRRV